MDYKEISAREHCNSVYYCSRNKRIPNVIREKPLEQLELFIVEIEKEKDEKKKENRCCHWCCYFKKYVRILFAQFKQNGQNLNMSNREILNSTVIKTVYPICKRRKIKKENGEARHCWEYDGHPIQCYINQICERNKDRLPYAGVLLEHLYEYFLDDKFGHWEEEPKDRIGIFYFHHDNAKTDVFLISRGKICAKIYTFNCEQEIYVSMRKSDRISVIPMRSIHDELSLKTLARDIILQRMTTNNILTKEDLEKLELPRTLLEELIIQGKFQGKMFRYLQ